MTTNVRSPHFADPASTLGSNPVSTVENSFFARTISKEESLARAVIGPRMKRRYSASSLNLRPSKFDEGCDLSDLETPSGASSAPLQPRFSLEGACLCGAVRYRVASAPQFRFKCHCRDCQRATGSGYAPIAVCNAQDVLVDGECTFYESQGGSGHPVARGFCPRCGSSLFLRAQILPGRLFILAGTLDVPESFKPRAHIHTRHAAAWDPLDPALPAFPDAAPVRT
jgi:hypothetical protein